MSKNRGGRRGGRGREGTNVFIRNNFVSCSMDDCNWLVNCSYFFVVVEHIPIAITYGAAHCEFFWGGRCDGKKHNRNDKDRELE